MFYPAFPLQPFQAALFRGEWYRNNWGCWIPLCTNPVSQFPTPPEGACRMGPPLHGLSQWEARIYTCSTSLGNINQHVAPWALLQCKSMEKRDGDRCQLQVLASVHLVLGQDDLVDCWVIGWFNWHYFTFDWLLFFKLWTGVQKLKKHQWTKKKAAKRDSKQGM